MQSFSPWSVEKIHAWHEKLPWLAGCNYIPHTAINQLEMWQADTFDTAVIDKELGWAEDLGFNTLRVFLHDVAWETDRNGFQKRIDAFLQICGSHRIRPFFVFFDDCWNPDARAGKQPEPKPGVHNSGWLQSPGVAHVNNPSAWEKFRPYVLDILDAFGRDERVLLWDLYNEPGNSNQQGKSLPFLREVFRWAREANPSQPLTSGIWNYAPAFSETNQFQLDNSDILSFHNYEGTTAVEKMITELKTRGRPLLCTEYMARNQNSTFQNVMPVFKRENVGAINWGFVAGKTNTIFPWIHLKDHADPNLWFHDILRPDGSPYDTEEIKVIKMLTRRA